MKNQIAQHLNVIKENVIDLITLEELAVKLERSLTSKNPLKLKIGFDPTARDIHLGHTVLLRKLRKLQDLGHVVYLVIGDFTAKIGDPSGRSTLRPMLSEGEIRENATTYTEQAFKILDSEKTKVVHNSTWYKEMKLESFLKLLASYTVARMLERDDFSKRMEENRPLTILEMVYPLIQGYDSVKIASDIEFGGTDQKFNLIVGRHLQEVHGQKPQVIVTMPILLGLDGKNKMSKSLGNYIGITEDANSMFGKLMSINDGLMWEYFRLLTDCELGDLKKMHPKDAKLSLAQTIVSYYHSKEESVRERKEFERVFSQKEMPSTTPIYYTKVQTVDILGVLLEQGLVSSKNEARRLLGQGSISLTQAGGGRASRPLKEQKVAIPPGGVIVQIGKKKFLKITRSEKN